MKKLIVAALVTVGLSGCSSVINGTTDSIAVRSSNPSAKLYIDGVPYGTEGAVFSAKRGRNYIIEAKSEGCQTGTVVTDDKFDATTLLGVFVDFGIFTIPTDLISGAAWKPASEIIMVNPICSK